MEVQGKIGCVIASRQKGNSYPSKLDNGRWTEPEMVPFCKGDSFMYTNPFIVPDGKKMFFTSTRSGAVSEDKENIWYVERTSSGWSNPKPISPEANSMTLHFM